MTDQPVDVSQMSLTPEVERKVLKLMLTDSTFATKWSGRLMPEHFQHEWSRRCFESIDWYYQLYKKLPEVAFFYDIVSKRCRVNDPTSEVLQYAARIVNSTDLADDTGGVQYLKDLVLTHMQMHDYEGWLITAAEAVRDRSYGEIEQTLTKVRMRHGDIPLPQPYSAESVVDRVKAESLRAKTVPSPWPTLNINHGGGFEPGTVAAFMGPTGSGKSILLINAGCAFIKQGKTVFHFTFELSRRDTLKRYDVCLAGVTHKERTANPQLVDNAIEDMRRKKGPDGKSMLGELYVVEAANGQCSVDRVMAVLHEFQSVNGKMPDAVILDYLTIMAPNHPENVDLKKDYAKLKVIAEEARAMAMMLNIPVVTAFQSNRGSLEKQTIKKEDVADSFAVIHVLDLVVSINQDDIAKQAGKMRLFVTKCRNYQDHYSVVCNVDYDKLQIVEDEKTTIAYNQQLETKKADPGQYRKAMQSPTGGMEHPSILDPDSADASLAAIVGIGQMQFKRREIESAPQSYAVSPAVPLPSAPPPATPG